MFLLVPAYPGCPGPKAVKRLSVCVCVFSAITHDVLLAANSEAVTTTNTTTVSILLKGSTNYTVLNINKLTTPTNHKVTIKQYITNINLQTGLM